jgi:hypothetical protein
VRQAGTEEVDRVQSDDLRLALQTPEGVRVDEPIAVHLDIRAGVIAASP